MGNSAVRHVVYHPDGQITVTEQKVQGVYDRDAITRDNPYGSPKNKITHPNSKMVDECSQTPVGPSRTVEPTYWEKRDIREYKDKQAREAEVRQQQHQQQHQQYLQVQQAQQDELIKQQDAHLAKLKIETEERKRRIEMLQRQAAGGNTQILTFDIFVFR